MEKKVGLIIALFIGFLLVIINIVKYEFKCPKKTTIYRYIPRTLEENMDNPVYVSDVFRQLFNTQEPNVFSVQDNITRKKVESPNVLFVDKYNIRIFIYINIFYYDII
jgi:hypothetical protein